MSAYSYEDVKGHYLIMKDDQTVGTIDQIEDGWYRLEWGWPSSKDFKIIYSRSLDDAKNWVESER